MLEVVRFGDWLVYIIVRLFICIIQTLRMETCDTVARGLAWIATDVVRLRRPVVEENLRRVWPELDDRECRHLTRRMWHHLFLMVCEIAHAPRKIHRTNWHRFVSIRSRRALVSTLLDPRPTVLVSGHYGNFELGGYITGLLGFSTFAVARPLDNPYLHDFVNRFRGAQGQFILPKQGSAAQIEHVLAHGGILSLLGDQHAGPRGCWVDFFGHPASSHKAIALFTLTSGAPLVVAYCRRQADRPLSFEVGVAGQVDPADPDGAVAGVRPLTQWYNRQLEEIILEDPCQYWWVHRRWKGTPPRGRKKPRAGSGQQAESREHEARSGEKTLDRRAG